MVYTSHSPEETQKIAAKIAQKYKKKGGVIALSGQLGAGKTTFVQGFAKALGIKEKIISPTFVLIREHNIPGTKRVLFHIDLYRLDDSEKIKEIGIEEVVKNTNNIVLIEWAEKAKSIFPFKLFYIDISLLDNQLRKICLQEIKK